MTAQHTDSHGIVDLDARVVEATVSLVKQAGLADLDRPTPCAGWNLADLLWHMTAQHYGWIAAAVGHGADLSVWQPGPPAADPIGEARKRDGAAFAPGVQVPEQAGLLDQILAMLGRSPSWPQ